MADVYKVIREASDGARWEGVAELDGSVFRVSALQPFMAACNCRFTFA